MINQEFLAKLSMYRTAQVRSSGEHVAVRGYWFDNGEILVNCEFINGTQRSVPVSELEHFVL